jgi:ADP-heptose:LPS heptosyltransferase
MNFCECDKPGYCPRYKRELYGRDREICRNENVDIGQAALIRNAWQKDILDRCPVTSSWPPVPVTLINEAAPGDVLVMTAALESLHAAHPGRFATAVQTTADAIFENNPWIAPIAGPTLHAHYPLIDYSTSRPVSFLQGYCDMIGLALNVPVPLITNRPHLYFTTSVKQHNRVVINAGYKDDFTAKHWGFDRYRKLVATMPDVHFVQVGDSSHHHESIGCENLVGKTSLRELFEVCRGAAAGVGPITLLQHVFAAVERPYVCIAGGREPVSWISYPKQTTLHAVGTLDCCQKACWKSNLRGEFNACEKPLDVPTCLARITPEEVALTLRRLLCCDALFTC